MDAAAYLQSVPPGLLGFGAFVLLVLILIRKAR